MGPDRGNKVSFDVEVAARSTRSLQRLLSDFVGDTATHTADDKLVLSVVEQSALVTLIARLTDLGTASNRSPPPAPGRPTHRDPQGRREQLHRTSAAPSEQFRSTTRTHALGTSVGFTSASRFGVLARNLL
jgi:hypothetical protein